MEEIKNNQSGLSVAQGYYVNKKRKVVDFLIGLLSEFFFICVAILLINNLSKIEYIEATSINLYVIILIFCLIPSGFIYFLTKNSGRKYIARGVIIPYIAVFIFLALLSSFFGGFNGGC